MTILVSSGAYVFTDALPGGEFQIVLSRPGPYDSLDILVESVRASTPGAESLARRIEREIRQMLTFRANVQLVPLGTVQQTAVGKAVRVVRNF